MVEQRTENPWVGGSNPPLNKKKIFNMLFKLRIFIIVTYLLCYLIFNLDISFCKGNFEEFLGYIGIEINDNYVEGKNGEKIKECDFFNPCGPDCPCGMNRPWFARKANFIIFFSAMISLILGFI